MPNLRDTNLALLSLRPLAAMLTQMQGQHNRPPPTLEANPVGLDRDRSKPYL